MKSDFSQGRAVKGKKQQLHVLAGKMLSGYKKKVYITIVVKQMDRLPGEAVEIFKTWPDSVLSNLIQLWC